MQIVKPQGATFVHTQAGEPLDVRPMGGNTIMLSNGERVQVKRYWSDAAIATGATGTALIATPGTGKYLVVLGYTVMCDADTLVTFKSDTTVVGMPLPIAANGGIMRPPQGQPLMVGIPDKNLNITTSGGNTYLDIHYIEVPLNVDIL